VYIAEAHPSDGWQMPANQRDSVIFKQPKTLAERAAIAKECLKSLNLTMPCLLDNMENTTEKAYGAWPDRLCVVDIAGKVAYYCPPGPKGFNPKEAEVALEEVLNNGGKMPANGSGGR